MPSSVPAPTARAARAGPAPADRAALPRAARRRARLHRRAAGRAPPGAAAGAAAQRERRARRARRRRAAATVTCGSTPASGATTSCPAAPPARRTGCTGCSRSPLGTPTRGEEVFVAPAVRRRAARRQGRGRAHALAVGRRRPARPAARAVGACSPSRPCHLLVETGGSGGVHAYWQLDQPLAATRVVEATGELVEPIERAHLRLIHHLGTDAHGKPNVADPSVQGSLARDAARRDGQLQDRRARADPRGRLRAARLPGRAARRRPPRPRARAAGGRRPAAPAGRARRPVQADQPAGVLREARRHRRPAAAASSAAPRPGTTTGTRRASSAPTPRQGWCCHAASCGARGAIYDLASVLLGGPYGRELRGEAFRRARAYVADVFGDLT